MITSNYSHSHAINPSVNTSISKSMHFNTNINEKRNSLAKYIYSFLEGITNTLPSYSLIDKIIQISNSDILSEGKGVLVKLVKSQDQTCYVLCIDYSTPITNRKSRVDIITPDNHTVNLEINETIINIININSNDKRLSKFPEKNEKRFEILRHYISGYIVKKSINERKKNI